MSSQINDNNIIQITSPNPNGFNSVSVAKPVGFPKRHFLLTHRAHVWKCDKCNVEREYGNKRGLDLWMRLHRKTCKGKKDE